MAEGEASQSQPQTQGSRRGQGQGRGRGARSSRAKGRGRGHADGASQRGRDAPSQDAASTAATDSQPPHPSASHSAPNASQGGQRPRRGGKRGGRGGRGSGLTQAPRGSTQRSFGGHLTSAADDAADEDDSAQGSLSVEAPEKPKSKPQAKPKVKLPKSTADDLGTRIHEDISNTNYECAVCTDDIVRSSSIWSCTLCWTVIHTKCVRRWYENQKKQDELQSSAPQREFTWRCPGCNSPLTDEPGSYHCWCGKDINPKPSSASLPPHSCGQTCSKPRPTCPHPCSLQCHAGPCPPCDLMGPTQSCFCGKNESRKLCRETDYENGWSCQQVCDDLLPCGEHSCPRPCHSGLCGDCEAVVDAKCYCGRVEKQVPCYERDDVQLSYNPTDSSWFDGSLSCGNTCERKFDCGVHACSETCHPQDEQPAHCPYSPDLVTHCPCGKTTLQELLGHPRQSCQDEVPHCERACEKVLPCGHTCKAKCHTGDCGFCPEMMDLSCRCGRTTTRSMCHQGDVQHPVCMRVCQVNLSCGRHKCGERCCTGEKKAAERQAAKRKHRVTGQLPAIEAEHICIRTCGRQLKCGSHTCQQICHRGPCGSCPEAIFHEISCDCGRTVLHPPQPCGTHAPDCRFNCRRRPACGHPPVEHNCHPDDVPCPKCPFLVEKWCACGKDKLQSQPCHLQEAHCGRLCGKKLKCGLHYCKKLCHRPGECADEGGPGQRCEQLCGKTKLFCDHPCRATCHGQTPCNESAACTSKTAVTCPCGVRKQEMKCLASSSNPTPTRPEIKCDDECLRLERNRRLASALHIDPSTHQNDHVPYSDTTLRLFKENTAWSETQEREFRVFSKSPNEARLRYKPMPSAQRQFLHVLAEDYGLESASEDAEPYRHVVVFKGPRFVSAPAKTLAQCIKIRETQAAEALAAARAASRPPSPPLAAVSEPFNSFILTSPRFGLTVDEVQTAFSADFATQPSLNFAVDFLPSDEVLLRASAHYSAFLTPSAMEQALTSMKSRIANTSKQTELAANVLLCHTDAAHHVSRRENLGRQDAAAGWSAVAGRAASRPDTPLGALSAEQPTAKTSGGRKMMLGLRKKRPEMRKEESWTAKLDGDVEC